MKVEKKELDALTAELTLVIEKSDYLPEYENQLKTYQQKAQLKGFRKGKTPLGIIKKMYGLATMQESVSKILGEKINEIITGDEIKIIGEPLFLDEDNVPEINHLDPQDYSYRFEIGMEPEFEVKGAGAEDKYEKKVISITEEMIDEEMEVAFKKLGEQKDVEGKFEEGDIVYLNIKELDGKKPIEDGFSSEFSVLWDDLTDANKKFFKGKSSGDKFEIDIYNIEKDLSRENVVKYYLKLNPEEEGVVIPEGDVFHAKISKITRLVKPEMNQDFFDKYFGKDQVSSEEEGREKIKSFLQDHFDRESTNLVNREIMQNLVDSNEFELPEGFLKKWVTREKEMSDEEFTSFLKELKWRIIKKKLVDQHEIKVEEKEILDYFVQMIRNYSPYIDEASLKNTVFSLMKNREQVNTAVEHVSSGKLFDALREVVKIDDKEISKDDFMKTVKEINQMAN